MRVAILALLLIPCLSCREFWCWPFCKDALQEERTDEAKAKHCRDVGDHAPQGENIKVYNQCMRESGLK